MGAANGKVRIEIDSIAGDIAAEDASWKVKTWRSGKWTEFVVPAVELLERFNRLGRSKGFLGNWCEAFSWNEMSKI